MTEAVLERRAERHEFAEGPATVLQLGWELGSETPVQGIVRGTEPQFGQPAPTNLPSLEHLNAGLASVVRRLMERDKGVTPVVVGNWIDDPITRAARQALIVDRPRVEGVLSAMLRRSLVSTWRTEFPELVAAPSRVRLGPVLKPEATLALTPLRAARELKDWLGLSWTELATAAGLNEGTIYYWQRTPSAAPRPATVAPLYELHSLTRAARDELSSEDDFRAWLHSPGIEITSPLEALRSANVEEYREAAQRIIFGSATGAPVPAPSLTWRDEDGPDLPSAPANAPRRASRQRSRVHLT